jgi:hypothetical protein
MHLHEAKFNLDWIEKRLAYETQSIRDVYNRAQYTDQRREMLQWWVDFVDSQIEESCKVIIIGNFGKAYWAWAYELKTGEPSPGWFGTSPLRVQIKAIIWLLI